MSCELRVASCELLLRVCVVVVVVVLLVHVLVLVAVVVAVVFTYKKHYMVVLYVQVLLLFQVCFLLPLFMHMGLLNKWVSAPNL